MAVFSDNLFVAEVLGGYGIVLEFLHEIFYFIMMELLFLL